MSPEHLRIDAAVIGSLATAVHDEACPDIGPICEVRLEPPQRHRTNLWLFELRLVAEYGLFKKLAVQAMLPLRFASSRTRYTDLNGKPKTLDYQNIHHVDGELVGLGDAQVFAHSSISFGDLLLGGRLGLALPLGNVVENPYHLGFEGKVHQHLQFGTGTFDPLLGIDATWMFDRWSLAAFGFARTPLYRGRYGYQAGPQLNGGLVMSSTPDGQKASIRASVSVAQEFAESWEGLAHADEGNLGRTDVYVGFGATVPFAADWSASVEVNARLWSQSIGAQVDLPVIVQLSLGRLFHLETGSHAEHEAGLSAEGDVLDLVANGEAAPVTGVPGKWTVIDFWAAWCEACVALDSELRELAGSRADLAVRRVNIVDFDSPIARQELPGVDVLPRVRLLSPTGTVVFEESGSPEQLMSKLQEAMVSYRCSMHPEIVRAEPGICPVCQMALTR